MQTRQHIEKLIRVSQMYYDEGLNQSQIAGEVGYSRSSVSRMLTEARETGIVQITIGHPLQRLQSLEENLRNKYGLKTVRVAYSYDDSIASTLVPQCAAPAAGGKPQTGFVDRYIDRDADGGDNQSFASP